MSYRDNSGLYGFFFSPTTLISQQHKLDPLIQITVRMAFKLYLYEPQYLGTTEKKIILGFFKSCPKDSSFETSVSFFPA